LATSIFLNMLAIHFYGPLSERPALIRYGFYQAGVEESILAAARGLS